MSKKDYSVGCKLEFDSVYKQYLAQKNMLNWQFYNQNVIKCEETLSTQNNVDETEEQKDFHVEKIDTTKETTKEIVKKKRKIKSAEQKTVEKNSRKKLKLMADLEKKLKKNR